MTEPTRLNLDGNKPSKDPNEKAPVFQTPPPAEPIPGISGNPPLPLGSAVAVTETSPGPSNTEQDLAKLYTKEELATLRTIPGWKPGSPIPNDLADVIAQASESARAEARDPLRIRPPVAPDTPPLEVPEPIDISKLSPEKQAEIVGALRQARTDREEDGTILGAGEGVNEAISGRSTRQIDLKLSDDLDLATYAGTDVPKQAAEPPTPPGIPVSREAASEAPGASEEPSTAPSRSGADKSLLTKCPHCSWPLSQLDPIFPDLEDKQRFLTATLGNQPFVKSYELLGGKLTVVLRELHPREIDQIYQQVHQDSNKGEVYNQQDFFEQLMRYRLCLQLREVRSTNFNFTCPDDLDAWGGQPDEHDVTVLPKIWEQLYTKVLRRESLHRMMGAVLANFNRLLAKLEANAQNSDFWKQTGQDI